MYPTNGPKILWENTQNTDEVMITVQVKEKFLNYKLKKNNDVTQHKFGYV